MIRSLIAATLLIGALYGVTEIWPLLAGPSLHITSPTNYAVVPGGILEVTGNATRISELTLDGLPLVYDQNGTFSSTLSFPHGGSILTLEARDRFGRTKTITRSIFVP